MTGGRIHQRLAELYSEMAELHGQLAEATPGEDYVDQRTSPLGARMHCRLVRQGVLPGYKAGRRILVRRADLDAYLAHQKVNKPGLSWARQLIAKHGGKAA